MESNEFISETDTIYDIVTKYPVLKEKLQELSPRFANLNNPVLFQTVARLTSVQKAAVVGKLYLNDMLYELNDAIGKGKEFLEWKKKELMRGKPLVPGAISKNNKEKVKPLWMDDAPGFEELDFRGKGEPFAEITGKAKTIEAGKGFKILQAFEPLPIISYLETLGFESFTESLPDGSFRINFYHLKGPEGK